MNVRARLPALDEAKRTLLSPAAARDLVNAGAKMAFAGIKNEQEIKDLAAYLKSFDESGQTKP